MVMSEAPNSSWPASPSKFSRRAHNENLASATQHHCVKASQQRCNTPSLQCSISSVTAAQHHSMKTTRQFTLSMMMLMLLMMKMMILMLEATIHADFGVFREVSQMLPRPQNHNVAITFCICYVSGNLAASRQAASFIGSFLKCTIGVRDQ